MQIYNLFSKTHRERPSNNSYEKISYSLLTRLSGLGLNVQKKFSFENERYFYYSVVSEVPKIIYGLSRVLSFQLFLAFSMEYINS